MANTIVAITQASGVKAQNEKWLATDYYVDKGAGKFRMSIAVNTNALLQITLDGTQWINMNENNPIKANSLYGFDIYLRTADTFNIRTPDATGTTVHFCRFDFIDTEG